MKARIVVVMLTIVKGISRRVSVNAVDSAPAIEMLMSFVRFINSYDRIRRRKNNMATRMMPTEMLVAGLLKKNAATLGLGEGEGDRDDAGDADGDGYGEPVRASGLGANVGAFSLT